LCFYERTHLALQGLLLPGATRMAVEVDLSPVAVLEAERAADAEARAARDAAWTEYLAAKAKSAAAAGGKAGGVKKAPVAVRKEAPKPKAPAQSKGGAAPGPGA
jgi:hypothetical protein